MFNLIKKQVQQIKSLAWSNHRSFWLILLIVSLAVSILIANEVAAARYSPLTSGSGSIQLANQPTPAGTVSQGQMSEEAARREIDGIYKGDYRLAFVEKKPELFLKHIPDDFRSVGVDGATFDAAALRQFFPQQFTTMVRTIEHNVTIEDIDVLPDGTISAIVTLYTLIEYQRQGSGTYFVTTIGTYRDDWVRRNNQWFEIRGNQLRNQTITALRP